MASQISHVNHSPCHQLRSSKGSQPSCVTFKVREWKRSAGGLHLTDWGWQECEKVFFKYLYLLLLNTCCRCNCHIECMYYSEILMHKIIECTSVCGNCKKTVAWTCLMTMMTLKMKKHLRVKWIIIFLSQVYEK